MRTLLLTFAVGVLAALPARADKAPAGATDTLKAAIKATGGQELLDKYKGGSMKMKGEIAVMGLDLEFEGDMIFLSPDKFKMTINTAIMGQKLAIDQIMNGKKLKMTLNGMAMPIDDHTRDTLQNSVAEQEISQLTPLLDAKKYKITAGDDAEVGGKKADVIVVNGLAEGSKVKDMKLFFDKETHLLVKMQKKETDETGKEIDEESFFEDYKKVQDIMTPMKGKVLHDGKDYMKFTMSEVKHLEKVDDKEFAVDD